MTDKLALAEQIERLAAEVDTDAELLGRVFALLDDFPANGKPQDHEAACAAVILGFIRNEAQKDRCPSCGTERVAYSYVKPTMAGRLFLAALRAGATDATG